MDDSAAGYRQLLGSIFEADFIDLQHNAAGVAAKALVDGKLLRRLRPKIMLRGKNLDYFVAKGDVPDRFTRVSFADEGREVRLALKIDPSDVTHASVEDWEISVGKDLSVQAVVSVVKAAHLTLFELFGYRYALSRAGAYVGTTLGSFFEENRGRNRTDVLAKAGSHFAAFAALVRPVANKENPLLGTIDDG